MLSRHLAVLLPAGARVLDVGCGDGLLSLALKSQRPDIALQGIETEVRKDSRIPVERFDGSAIPFPPDSFDVVLFVDVLHHTKNPAALLGEAVRVSRRYVVLKDHCLEGLLAGPTLRFMDRVGNARYGVALPYNYWTKGQWHAAFERLGLHLNSWEYRLRLYPAFARWIFERRLHFIAKLEKLHLEAAGAGGRPGPRLDER